MSNGELRVSKIERVFDIRRSLRDILQSVECSQFIEIFRIELHHTAARRAEWVVGRRIAQQRAQGRQRTIGLRVEVVASFQRDGDATTTQFVRQGDELARHHPVTGDGHRH